MPMSRRFPDDPHTHSRPNEIVVRHVSLDLTADFESRRVSGLATLSLEHRSPDATVLVLDTWQLEVAAVTLGDGTQARFELGDHNPVLGSSLSIHVGSADSVVVHYATSPDAQALQWLGPSQTASGKRFLFTQSQAILARSWIPLQDTPSVRITYDATVRVPPDLLAVMSADGNPVERTDDGTYRFSMPEAVPSYLIALGVGDLEFRPLGDRCGVYAEPPTIEAAAWEFAETESMVAAAERLFGPYRWGRYDLLVLPPSFPYGGMENPRLTFVTPTVIAGDRSLVTLVAHEIAHSWSGNLVTNATWNDVWLNEGFTTYVETRIDEELYGAAYTAMLLRLERRSLESALATLDPRDTWLELDLAGRDPDDGSSAVPYDKGSLFLRLVEQTVGRERFDEFLEGYFDRFAFESMDTPTFLAHLRSELLGPAGVSDADLDLKAWVHGPGLPDNAPVFASEAFAQVEQQVAALVAGGSPADLATDGWVSHQWVHFVRALPRDLPPDRLAEIDGVLDLTGTGNNEVLVWWLDLTVESGYVFAAPEVDRAVADFLTRQGRAKYLKPIYQRFAATPQGLARAKQIYESARPGYHPVSARIVDRILDWS